jgi:hypothetical protein
VTTSGTAIYQLSRDSFISAAMRKCGALAAGQSPSAEDLTNCQVGFNALVAQYQTLGMPLWKRAQYSLTMTATSTYTIGVGQTTNTVFPLKIESAVVRRSGGSSQEMSQLSRKDFNLLNSSSTGTPTQFTYQPMINYGVLKVWPIPDATNIADNTIELTYFAPVEGFTAAAETSDFPQEWQLPLIYGLAAIIAPEYGVPLPDQQNLQKQAKTYLDTAVDFGFDNSSFFIQPERH